MNKVIVVQANVESTKTDDFLKLANEMVAKSRAESGCLTYELSRNLNNTNEFFFYEKYADKEAMDNHNTSAHFKNFINAVMPLLTKNPSIETFNAE